MIFFFSPEEMISQFLFIQQKCFYSTVKKASMCLIGMSCWISWRRSRWFCYTCHVTSRCCYDAKARSSSSLESASFSVRATISTRVFCFFFNFPSAQNVLFPTPRLANPCLTVSSLLVPRMEKTYRVRLL